MFKLEFDPANKSLAAAIGAALVSYGTGAEFTAELTTTETTTTKVVGDASLTETVKTSGPAGNSSETPDKSASVAGATDTSTTTETATSAAAAGSAVGHPDTDPNNLDEKGVGKNPNFCSNAQIPFNQSGKKKGQWKKKQGVDENVYDEWYASELTNVSTAGAATTAEETPVDTGAAFGNNQKQAPAAGGLTFTDAGQFMAWVAEQQTAELLTQGDIDSAYQMTSTQVHDLFNPQLFPAAVKAVYEFLAPIAAGEA